MTAVLQPLRRPALDRDGLHWQTHGQSGQIVGRNTGEPVTTITAHSVRHPRLVMGRPHVLLESAGDPCVIAARLTPESARALAASLLLAADRADEVRSSMGLQP